MKYMMYGLSSTSRKVATIVVLFGVFSILLHAIVPTTFAHEHRSSARTLGQKVQKTVHRAHDHLKKVAHEHKERVRDHAQHASRRHAHDTRLKSCFSHTYDFVCERPTSDMFGEIAMHVFGDALMHLYVPTVDALALQGSDNARYRPPALLSHELGVFQV